jgi:hypothetical protein
MKQPAVRESGEGRAKTLCIREPTKGRREVADRSAGVERTCFVHSARHPALLSQDRLKIVSRPIGKSAARSHITRREIKKPQYTGPGHPIMILRHNSATERKVRPFPVEIRFTRTGVRGSLATTFTSYHGGNEWLLSVRLDPKNPAAPESGGAAMAPSATGHQATRDQAAASRAAALFAARWYGAPKHPGPTGFPPAFPAILSPEFFWIVQKL